MNPFLRILALSAFVLLGNRAHATISADIFDNIGAPGAVTITAGNTFAIGVSVTATTESTIAFTYRFVISPGGSGKFSIATRDTTGSAFPDLQSTNAVVLLAANALLDTSNNNDLGGSVSAGPTTPSASPLFVANFTISTLVSLAPGNYSLSFTPESSVGDDGFSETSVSDTYTITVIPEPASAMLIAAGSGLLLFRRRRA